MRTAAALLTLPALGYALPGMMGGSREEAFQMLEKMKREADAQPEADVEERDVLSGTGLIPSVSSLLSDVSGLVGSVAESVDPNNKRPEPGYEFIAPGPNDSRGPCPGLNLLANYGYLPRDGYVNFGQVVEAASRGFNMDADLATVLLVFAVLANGDIETESFYLGTGPNNVGGLNRHDTVECDVSPNREDYYLGCGDNHDLSSRLFEQNVAFAAEGASKQFDLETMGKQYAANADFSLKNNPYLYYFPFPSIVSLGAFAFYPNFFSNGTYRAGGVANYESISSIIGAKLNEKTGHFEYVPERWPENWYRRATPYGAVTTLVDALASIYPQYPLIMPFPEIANSADLTPNTILCTIYQGLTSITPLALSGTTEEASAAVSWALGKLGDVGISNTILGCPTNSISPNSGLYPNASMAGGPLNPPPSVVANTGNDVFYKTYFESAPTKPQCKPSKN